MFSNTLHLMLHPGTDSIEAAGGLHTFIGRQRKPLITDSGGFQIFSFANRGKDAMPGAGVDTSSYTRPADKESYGAEHSHSELKSSRHDNARLKWSRIDDDVLGPEARPKVFINEEGARFRSYRDGSLVELTPESTVRAQKAIGADIIILLTTCQRRGRDPTRLRPRSNERIGGKHGAYWSTFAIPASRRCTESSMAEQTDDCEQAR